jgi:hypothetical protein
MKHWRLKLAAYILGITTNTLHIALRNYTQQVREDDWMEWQDFCSARVVCDYVSVKESDCVH